MESEARRGRPLWQLVLAFFVAAFVVRRGVVAYLFRANLPAWLLGAYALQVLAGLLVARGIWTAASWVRTAVVVLGGGVAATALAAGFTFPEIPLVASASEVLFAVLATAGLSLILRHELGPHGTASKGERRPGPRGARADPR